MATSLFYLFLILAASGACSLFVALCFWTRVEALYVDLVPRGVIVMARLGSAVATVAAKSHGTGPQASDAWNEVFAAAVASWALWELAQVVADYKSRKTLKKAKELERQVAFRTSLLTSLRRLVLMKRERVQEELTHPTGQVPIHRARQCLSPRTQAYLVVEQLALFLKWLHQEPDTEEALHQNFRIGIYAADNGVMRPFLAYDYNNQNYDPFTSHRAVEHFFRLDNEDNPAHVVRCVKQRALIIVSDCEEEWRSGTFTFFSEPQRNYLKSMLAYPILGFRRPDGTMTEGAVVIDTDVPGHFKEADRRAIQFFLDDFAPRLNLETLLLGLLG